MPDQTYKLVNWYYDNQWLEELYPMKEPEVRTTPDRRYPPFWEKFIPIALGTIAVIIVILLLIAIAVATGIFPGFE